MHDGIQIIAGRARRIKRKIGAYREGEGCGGQTWFPSAIPGTYHDGDGKDDKPAFDDIGQQQRRYQSQTNAEDGNAVTQDGCPGGSDMAAAEEGGLDSHTAP